MMPADVKELFSSYQWEAKDFFNENTAIATDFVALTGLPANSRVLDLGCGSGSLCVELALLGHDVVGYDIHTQPAKDRMKARSTQYELIERDMRLLASQDEFDVVVNWDVSGIGSFLDLADTTEMMRKIYKALKPGGMFLLETYNLEYIQEHPARVEGLIYDVESGLCNTTIRLESGDQAPKVFELALSLFSAGDCQQMLRAAGFRLTGTWGSLQKTDFSKESRMLVVLAEKL